MTGQQKIDRLIKELSAEYGGVPNEEERAVFRRIFDLGYDDAVAKIRQRANDSHTNSEDARLLVDYLEGAKD